MSAAAEHRQSDACGSAWAAGGLALLFDAPLVVHATDYLDGEQTDATPIRWLFGNAQSSRRPITLGLRVNIGKHEEPGHFFFTPHGSRRHESPQDPPVRRTTPGLKGGMDPAQGEGPDRKRKSQDTHASTSTATPHVESPTRWVGPQEGDLWNFYPQRAGGFQE